MNSLTNVSAVMKSCIDEEEEKSIADRLLDIMESEKLGGMTEKEQERKLKKIEAKLDAGEKLTAEEMRFLRSKDKGLYYRVLRVQIKRKRVEEKMKNCKSKKEVEEVQDMMLVSVPKNDIDKKWMISAIKKATEEFKETKEYRSLSEKDDKKKDIFLNKLYEYSIKNGQYQELYETEEIDYSPVDFRQ